MTQRRRQIPRDIALISVSIDLGAGRRGVDMGPSALRIAGITADIEAIGHSVTELGTITAGGLETTEAGGSALPLPERDRPRCRPNPGRGETGAGPGLHPARARRGSLHLDRIGVSRADHYREREASIGVIWVDAHADMNQPHTTPTGNIHGMPLAVLLGHGDALLTRGKVSVRPENVSVLGARSLDGGEKRLIRELGVRVFTMSEIDERGVAPCMDEALERAGDGTCGFHLSLDLDALDPRIAPGSARPFAAG